MTMKPVTPICIVLLLLLSLTCVWGCARPRSYSPYATPREAACRAPLASDRS